MTTLGKQIEFHPLTSDRWSDFELLLGDRGGYGGCWCMWWRESRAEFVHNQGDGNRRLMKEQVESGQIPGILVYIADKPAGWCSIAPRSDYSSLNRSRVLKPLDDEPVWSLVCFFVGKEHRGRGLIVKIIQAAVVYVRGQGGRIVEAYPTVPRGRRLPPVSSYMGFPQIFERAGFVLCAQPSEARAVMRFTIDYKEDQIADSS